MKLLHIVASPRLNGSTTLEVSQTLLTELGTRFPELKVDTHDLFQADLPALAGVNIEAKYSLMQGGQLGATREESWAKIEAEIARFLAADVIVITAPMWNFGIPYTLKYYIDCIVQPGYLFRYGEGGIPTPLVSGKRAVVVTSSGSDYSSESPMHALDHHEPYLRAILAFVGITDVTFIHGHAADIPAVREARLSEAHEHARALAASDGWPETVAA